MARAVLLLLAAAAVALAIVRAEDDRDCGATQREAFGYGLRLASSRAIDPDAVVRRAEAGCTGGAPLAAIATGLLRGGATEAAGRLARTATERDPEDHRGWRATLAVEQARGNTLGAREARERVTALDPPRPAPG